MARRALLFLALVASACSSRPPPPETSGAGPGDASPPPVPWVYPSDWHPTPMSFNTATRDRWYVQTSGGRMLCETPCSTWVPPDTSLELQHAEDSKTVLRISKKRLASFEGRPAGVVVRREVSYKTALTLLATGLGVGALGAVLIGFGADNECDDASGVLCGTGTVFATSGFVLSVAAIVVGGRLKSSYEIEEVPPWLMGHPSQPPPHYVPPPELLPAPTTRTPQPAPSAPSSPNVP